MINFYKTEDKLIFTYSAEYTGTSEWILEALNEDGEVTFKNTFTFKTEDRYEGADATVKDDIDSDEEFPTEFILAELEGDYYKIKREIVLSTLDIYLHKDMPISINLFVAYPKISIFGSIESLVSEDIYIGGDNSNSIPVTAFLELVSTFPNLYERKKYAEARIASILRNYFETTKDAEANYHKYMNKKVSRKGADLFMSLKGSELIKYEAILDKLEGMIKAEKGYTERQWQEEIVQIIRLLYPKYIAVFKEVPINDKSIKERYLDFMLVDSSGHADIVEIKQPFNNCIITEKTYRDNYIPLRELSGTIMQIEKYIYYLNRWGADGEKKLNEKYKNELPSGLDIKITNPGGLIIMGRDNKLTLEQKRDFEVVKRKYKNVIDIITYDDLLRRLKFTIEQIKKS